MQTSKLKPWPGSAWIAINKTGGIEVVRLVFTYSRINAYEQIWRHADETDLLIASVLTLINTQASAGFYNNR